MALSNGTTVILDADQRPELRSSGIVASNFRGSWRVPCTSSQEIDSQAHIAAYICSYLGFKDYYKYKMFPRNRLRHKILTPSSNYSTFSETRGTQNCSLFYVKCSDAVTHPKMSYFLTDEERLEQQVYSPWNAAIYVDGKHQCVGVLIGFSWVLTTTNCFRQELQCVKANSFSTWS